MVIPKQISSIETILTKLNNGDLMLPDFQRGFVWDGEQIRKLFSSVLCRNPIGSILTLKSNDSNFSCKKIGAQPRTCYVTKKDGVVDFLIDGQQRLTSLLAGFSTYYHQAFSQNPKDIANKELLKIYFLKIPARGNIISEDFFGVRTFEFPEKLDFSTNDILPYIESKFYKEIVKNEKTKSDVINIFDSNVITKITNYCTSSIVDESGNEYYRIPLQFIKHQLSSILGVIAANYAQDTPDVPKQMDWITKMYSYLDKCINSELQLSEIEVEDSDKSRAIDIYNNLNQGGVELSVLDLIIATVGAKSDRNFYDMLLDEMTESFTYKKESLPTNIQNLLNNQTYDPVERANVICKNSGEIKSSYASVFLDVLALIINREEGFDFNISVTKETQLLKLTADQIIKHYKSACKALARALFFFQTRCGIKFFDDINYKAQLTVIAYFFSKDEYFENIKVNDLFEYWYWISIFGWMYKSNQKVEILNTIPKLQEYILSKQNITNIAFLQEYKKEVFNVKFYSNETALTMENVATTGQIPPKVMSKYICQFYLSKDSGYESFFKDSKQKKTDYDSINFLFDDKLEMHHLMPLGGDKDINALIKKITTDLKRNKPEDQFNSPLNMLYITHYDNITISNMSYDTYSKDPRIQTILNSVGCPLKADGDIQNFLKARFVSLKSDVEKRLSALEKSLVNGVNP